CTGCPGTFAPRSPWHPLRRSCRGDVAQRPVQESVRSPGGTTALAGRGISFQAIGDGTQDRHANSEAVGDLFPDDGAAAVGEAGFDLDAAIHRPWMHHDGVRRRQLHPFMTDTVVGEVLVDSRYAVEIADALALDA